MYLVFHQYLNFLVRRARTVAHAKGDVHSLWGFKVATVPGTAGVA
jgi:hypothetical protein